MKVIKTVEAEGHVLCHDITKIVKDQFKGTAFRKGHIVKKEDIPVLLKLGKEHLYVWEKAEGMLHENEAAKILYDLCAGPSMNPTEVREGKIEILAEIDGLLQVDVKRLYAINALGEMMIATRRHNTPVKKGDRLAGTRIIPLIIENEKIKKAKAAAGDTPLLQILPFRHKKAGIIVTGNEVYEGLIEDTFSQVIKDKLSPFDTSVIDCVKLPDDHSRVTKEIKEMVKKGADMVICTGGMSVDPDDKTPLAIKNTGADIITYGAPTLPGAMFLIGYYQQNTVIMGLPGCVMYAGRTIFDIILPRVLAEMHISKEDIAALGHGGFCINCEHCIFPNCSFGAGM